MTAAGQTVALIDPAAFVASQKRLLVDTNIFLDTDPSRQGGLKRLFERCAGASRVNHNPIIVPSKVLNELSRHSRMSVKGRAEQQVSVIAKAKNALVFLQSAENEGVVRTNLGDQSNPYADDLFVRIFETFSSKYEMCLLTNDTTLQLRIRLLEQSSGFRMVTGMLNRDGLVAVDDDQVLYRRGLAKLRRKMDQNDARETEALEPLLAAFRQFLSGTSNIVPFAKVSALRPPDRALGTSEIPGLGGYVHVASPENRGQLILQQRKGKGGEGTVYAVGDSWVVKVFDSKNITLHRKEKVELLASRGMRVPGICIPEACVTNSRGEFIGYIMPAAHGEVLQRTIFNPRRFRKTFPEWTKADLVDVCISFLEKLAYLHSLNIVAGDINPKNLMVDAEKNVWIIDADSWQVEGYPCPVGTPMFTPPSLSGKSYAEFLRTEDDELFAVATMLFMILITGQFPYSRAGSDGDIVNLIKEGNFAFQYKDNNNQDQPEGNWKYMWSHIPPDVKGMFWNTFHRDGDRYVKRPTVEEWLTTFRQYRDFFRSVDNFDPMSNDVYPTRYKAFRPDTPIYECRNCNSSLVGWWHEESKTYSTPQYCHKCLRRVKCVDCDKKPQARDLTDGRCKDCRPATCGSCATPTPRSRLTNGRCATCHQKASTLDSARVCARCSKPFIKIGTVEQLERKGARIPTGHRSGHSLCTVESTATAVQSVGAPVQPTASPLEQRTTAGHTVKPSQGRSSASHSTPSRESAWVRLGKWLQT